MSGKDYTHLMSEIKEHGYSGEAKHMMSIPLRMP